MTPHRDGGSIGLTFRGCPATGNVANSVDANGKSRRIQTIDKVFPHLLVCLAASQDGPAPPVGGTNGPEAAVGLNVLP
jgi:hypothetical protein